MEAHVTAALQAAFKPEFLNRIDETIIFHNLTRAQIREIVMIQTRHLTARLAEKKLAFELSDDAAALIARAGYDPVYGARPLKRAIQKLIENPLALEILKGGIPEGSRITASADTDGASIRFDVGQGAQTE